MSAVGDSIDPINNPALRLRGVAEAPLLEREGKSSRDEVFRGGPNFGRHNAGNSRDSSLAKLDSRMFDSVTKGAEDLIKQADPSTVLGMTKDGFVAGKINSTEQAQGFSKLLSQSPLFALTGNAEKDKLITAKRDALAGVLAELPDSQSVKNLSKSLLKIQSSALGSEAKDAQTLALISKHLAEARKSDSSLETNNRHQTLLSNLIQSSGIKKDQADLAVKFLERVPADKQAEAIQLALELTKDPKLMSALSVLQKLAGPDGKLDASDLQRVKQELVNNILKNPQTDEERAQRNQAHQERELALRGEIQKGAPKQVLSQINKKLRESTMAQWFPGIAKRIAEKGYAKALRAINNWEPGAVAGRGNKNKIAREIYEQMNKAYAQNQPRSIQEMNKAVAERVESQLNEKFTPKVLSQLNLLNQTIGSDNLQLPNHSGTLRSGELERLKALERLEILFL